MAAPVVNSRVFLKGRLKSEQKVRHQNIYANLLRPFESLVSDGGSFSTTLLPANDAVGGNRKFEQFIKEKLKSKLLEEELPTTKKALNELLEKQLKKFGIKDLKEIAENGLQYATNDQEDWSQKHQKQPGRYVQNFLTTFSRYLEAYSGVVEVVKSAGQPYGQVAYSTLSLFLIACSSMLKFPVFLLTPSGCGQQVCK